MKLKKRQILPFAASAAIKFVATLVGYPVVISFVTRLHRWITSLKPEYIEWINVSNVISGSVILFFYIAWLYKATSKALYDVVMPDRGSGDDKDAKRMTSAIALMMFLGASAMLVLLAVDFIGHVRKDVAVFQKDPLATAGGFLGTFGDFFGGVVNPVLTFLTFIALALTMVMQRIQLKESGELSRLQTFETTFFNLLNLHNATVQDLRYIPNSVVMDYEKKTSNSSRGNAATSRRNRLVLEGRQVLEEVLHTLEFKTSQKNNIGPVEVYNVIQKSHNHILGRYFRNLYQILEFIDDHAKRFTHDPESIDLPGKRYSDIVRAQLSSSELLLLFYNCNGETVDKGQFRELVKKYELLEHISLERTSKGQIGIPRFPFQINPLVEQYFYLTQDGKIDAPGAFGKNPVMEEYLIEMYNYFPKPVEASRVSDNVNRLPPRNLSSVA